MCCDRQSDTDIKINSCTIKNLTVLGGDARALAAAEKFIRWGYKVTLCGFSEADSYPRGAIIASSTHEALSDADILLLPLPITRDGIHVSCPLGGATSVELGKIPSAIKKSTLVFGGKMPSDFKSLLDENKIYCFDYYDSPTLQLICAHITAEGALMYAMEATDTSLLGRNIAIIGYGRIARRLCRLCVAFGASVTVFARREESRAEARLDGASSDTLTSDSLCTLTRGYDVIFNTVPSRIMTPKTVSLLPQHSLYIELASSPFGIDATDARGSAARIIWASSIPGKYAPATAGEIIAVTVRDEISRVIRSESKAL